MFPKTTHETFSQKLYQTFKDHRHFIKPKLTRSDFTIVHYAGEVSFILYLLYRLMFVTWIGVEVYSVFMHFFSGSISV
jgi:hypothetical protein